MVADDKILGRSKYRDVWAKINNIKIKLRDKYRGKSYFPIGTKRPIHTYVEEGDVPEDEIKFFKLDTVAPNNSTSICALGQSGTYKTTLIKTLTYYNSLIENTKIAIMSLKEKSDDWEKCNFIHKNPNMLFPDEPATIPITTGCPQFALKDVPTRDKAKINVLNLPPSDFSDLDVLTGLGFSPMAKQHLYRMLRSGMTPDEIRDRIEELYKKKKLSKPSYDNLSVIYDNMLGDEFLVEKDFIDINKEWDNGSHWALGFNNKLPKYLSVYVDKLLTKIFDRANTNKGARERYWVIVDDALKAFGLDITKYPSVQRGIDSLTLWRSVGINMVITAQSPTMLNEEIYADIKHFFVYRCSQTHILAKYIPNRKIIDEIKTLVYQPENYVSECIHIYPDRYRYERFFPFNSPIAN